MFYTIYKVTNKINGKFYIGKHQTEDLDDGYLGSGKLIRAAVAKYGRDRFEKEILHVFETEDEMNACEKELVVLGENSYNLCEGGQGGFGYINANKHLHPNRISNLGCQVRRKILWKEKWINDDKFRQKALNASRLGGIRTKINYPAGTWKNKRHTEETKAKLRKTKNVGETNSQYGTMWITDGIVSSKISKSATIPFGWRNGRTLRNSGR